MFLRAARSQPTATTKLYPPMQNHYLKRSNSSHSNEFAPNRTVQQRTNNYSNIYKHKFKTHQGYPPERYIEGRVKYFPDTHAALNPQQLLKLEYPPFISMVFSPQCLDEQILHSWFDSLSQTPRSSSKAVLSDETFIGEYSYLINDSLKIESSERSFVESPSSDLDAEDSQTQSNYKNVKNNYINVAKLTLSYNEILLPITDHVLKPANVRGTLVLMRGAPGSGKSHLVDYLADNDCT